MLVGICALLALAGIIALCVWGNRALTVGEYTLADGKLPAAFSGFRLVQISDLHSARFGKENKRLLNRIQNLNPDIIVITGDLIYGRSQDTRIAADFAVQAAKLAPVYFVPGNHESRMEDYPVFRKSLQDAGVTVLENKRLTLHRNKESVTLLGILDPCFFTRDYPGVNKGMVRELLKGLVREEGGFQILLSHRPELFDVYSEVGIDLTFAGHAHGGQIRIPGIGGLYAPGQGFLPKYTSGIHTKGKSRMVVSRGLGKSLFPLRIGNRPEIVCLELRHI